MGSNSKDKRDTYYFQAKTSGYRARSAYKLLDLDSKLDLFNNNNIIIGLCCAPGSWSQVCVNKLRENFLECRNNFFRIKELLQHNNINNINKKYKYKKLDKYNQFLTENSFDYLFKKFCLIISVDLFQIKPIDNVKFIKADITTKKCTEKIKKLIKKKQKSRKFRKLTKIFNIFNFYKLNTKLNLSFEEEKKIKLNLNFKEKLTKNLKEEINYNILCLSDGAPDITGESIIDEYNQNMLICAAVNNLTQSINNININNNNISNINNKKIKVNFIAKMFRGNSTCIILNHLKKIFDKVELYKPRSSRNKSIECFVYCEQKKSEDFNAMHLFSDDNCINSDNLNSTDNNIQLINCGEGTDPDIVLLKEFEQLNLKHNFPPISPPYLLAIKNKQKNNNK